VVLLRSVTWMTLPFFFGETLKHILKAESLGTPQDSEHNGAICFRLFISAEFTMRFGRIKLIVIAKNVVIRP
jgi:hypothetical protein